MINKIQLTLVTLLLSGLIFSTSAEATQNNAHIYYPNPEPFPYSSAVKAGNTLYISGITGFDSKTNSVPENVVAEIKLIMDQMKAVLAQAGMSMDDVVKMDVFCTDHNLYGDFNTVEATYFDPDKYPARSFISISPLVDGERFEVDAVAVKQ